jgi:hypothetical protein
MVDPGVGELHPAVHLQKDDAAAVVAPEQVVLAVAAEVAAAEILQLGSCTPSQGSVTQTAPFISEITAAPPCPSCPERRSGILLPNRRDGGEEVRLHS